MNQNPTMSTSRARHSRMLSPIVPRNTGRFRQAGLWRKGALCAALTMASMVGPRSQAVTIMSGPVVTQAPNAPLAGVLTVNTDVPSRVSISVNDGTNTWQRNFYDFSTNHSQVLLGFKPNHANQITVTVVDKNRNSIVTQPVTFTTSPLPVDFPTSVMLVNNQAK